MLTLMIVYLKFNFVSTSLMNDSMLFLPACSDYLDGLESSMKPLGRFPNH